MLKNLKVAICDDEEKALEVMGGAVSMAFNSHKVKADLEKFASVKTLAARMEKTAFDVILLDINIGQEDGIEFANGLRKKNNAVDIIFISSCEHRVFEAFAARPFGFVRKSNFLQDITENVAAYLESKESSAANTIVLQLVDFTVSLSVYEIVYIEGQKKKQNVYTRGGAEPLSVRNKMESLEEQLKEYGFMRVHKGYIVNYRFIRLIGSTEIELTTNGKIPISRRNVEECRSRYLELMQRSGSLVVR